MKQKYPEMRFILPAYFHQDFGLDYDTMYAAADEIIKDNRLNPRLSRLIAEMKSAIDQGEELNEDFFTDIGLDTAPNEDIAENIKLFEYFLKRHDDLSA